MTVIATGEHIVTLRMTGYAPYSTSITITFVGFTNQPLPIGGTGYYEIVTDPQGAQVTFDGTFKGYGPVTIPVSTTGTPGHTVIASMPGYQTASREVSGNPSPGETVTVSLILTPIEPTYTITVPTTVPATYPPVGGGKGYFHITTYPSGASITFDSRLEGVSPVTVEVSTTGSPQHSIVASKTGYQTASRAYNGNPLQGETVEIEMTLQPETQMGSVYVSSSPSPVTATIDGSDAKQTPCSFSNVIPGYHTVQVYLSGYQPYSDSVRVTAGAMASVYASLSPVQTWGSLRVTSSPSGASLYVDGIYRGEAPMTISDLATGSHTVRLRLAGYQEWSGSATVASETTTVYSAALTQVQSPNYGAITVHSEPAGASVYLDGNLVGKTPVGSTLDLFSIAPGAHTLLMKLPGYQDYSTTVNVASGDIARVGGSLIPVTPAPAIGSIAVSSTPAGADILLDNAFKGITPLTVTGVTTGEHTVTIRMTGYAPYSTSTVVSGGQTVQVVANLTPPQTPTAPPTTTPTKSPVSIMLVIIAIGGIVLFTMKR